MYNHLFWLTKYKEYSLFCTFWHSWKVIQHDCLRIFTAVAHAEAVRGAPGLAEDVVVVVVEDPDVVVVAHGPAQAAHYITLHHQVTTLQASPQEFLNFYIDPFGKQPQEHPSLRVQYSKVTMSKLLTSTTYLVHRGSSKQSVLTHSLSAGGEVMAASVVHIGKQGSGDQSSCHTPAALQCQYGQLSPDLAQSWWQDSEESSQ